MKAVIHTPVISILSYGISSVPCAVVCDRSLCLLMMSVAGRGGWPGERTGSFARGHDPAGEALSRPSYSPASQRTGRSFISGHPFLTTYVVCELGWPRLCVAAS